MGSIDSERVVHLFLDTNGEVQYFAVVIVGRDENDIVLSYNIILFLKYNIIL